MDHSKIVEALKAVEAEIRQVRAAIVTNTRLQHERRERLRWCIDEKKQLEAMPEDQ